MNQVLMGVVAMTLMLVAIPLTGCVAGGSLLPAAGTATASPAPIPAAVTQMTTVASVPTTPACANPPLNPWWGVPESYVSPLSREAKSPPAPGTLISKADLYGTPTHTWEEYDRTAQIRDLPDSSGTTRYEISKEDRKGRPEVHKRIIQTTYLDGASPEQDMETTTDVFYDEFHAILSQHTRSVSKTGAATDTDGPPDSPCGEPDCSGELFSPMYTFIGTETLTVPAGTFPDARKYTEKMTDDSLLGKSATSTHWFAPGIPAELKRELQSREKGVLMTWELTGWGGTIQ